ncbi:MAG: Ig-like domain-containing protein, partial [Mariniblastus sp.]|nr:Ig-like domain-containing protein [Mariniblastus sp.]
MKRKRRKSRKPNRAGSAAARNRKRPERSPHGRHDYNLLEPRLLLVNYHFGDAPEPYPVTFADHHDVARHGTGTDSSGSTSDGEHSDYANSKLPPFYTPSIVSPGGKCFVDRTLTSTYLFEWDPNETYYVDGWVDWNQDGDWLDSDEQIFRNVPFDPFSQLFFGDGDFPVPDDAALGGTFGRFRVSSVGGLQPNTGLAPDGLMDDVFFHVVQPDFENPDSHGFAGLGEPSWGPWFDVYPSNYFPIPKLADFNQDGDTDIFHLGYFIRYSTGTFAGRFSQTFFGALASSNRVGDINGDDRLDVVEAEYLEGTYNGVPLEGQGIAVSSLDGSTVNGWANLTSLKIDSDRFGVVDYDGDGRDDLVAETINSDGWSDGIYWLRGQTDYSLTSPTEVASVFQAAPLAQADMDGDGDIDLISREAVYLRSNGTGTNFSRIALATPIRNYRDFEVLTTDLDQDGWREVVGLTASGNHTLTIQELNGSGFNTVYTRGTRYDPGLIVTDLDDDAHDEVIIAGANHNQISVLQFDGNFSANVQTYNHPDTDLTLHVVGAGDVGRNWTTEYPSGTDFTSIPITTTSPSHNTWDMMGALFYEVTPAPENQPPTLDPIGDRTIQENASWQTVTLTGISDGDADYNQPLRVTASSNNPGLIPNSENYLEVEYLSDDPSGTLRFRPVPEETGSVVITVTVEDGGLDDDLSTPGDNLSFSRNFTVTVNAGNDPPTLDPIADRTIDEDATEQTVTLTGITDGDTGNQPLRVTATSNNPGLISNPTVVYQSPNSTGSIRFTPVADQYGIALITVTVEDGGNDNDLGTTGDNLTFSQTFTVTVNPVNDAPLLDPISDRSVQKNASQQTVGLTGIRAGGGESQPLRVTATSNNTNLIPTPVVDYTSANSTGTLRFTPAANQTGSAVITVTVEDGGLDGNLNTSQDNLTTSRSFTVTVEGVNFFASDDQLLLELNNPNQQITATSEGSHYTFTLNDGFWFGNDSSFVSGSGTSQLTVTNAGRSQFTEIRVDDNAAGSSFRFADSGNQVYTEQFVIQLDRMDAGDISFRGTTRLSGNAGITASTTRSISLAVSGTRLETVDGDIDFSANRQATPRSFGSDGVTLIESTIAATGLGDITLSGRGGYTEIDGNCGVDLLHGSATASIVTQDGNLTIDGIGGGAGQSKNNFGLHVGSFGKVGSTGSGQVTIQGVGGVGSGPGQTGVSVYGLNGDAEISTVDGLLRVTGQGSSTGYNRGVAIHAGGKIGSTGQGEVIVDGTAGNHPSNNQFGVLVEGISDRGTIAQIVSLVAPLSVTGRGGGGGDGTGNHGVIASTGGVIRGAAAASLTVTGTAGQSTGGWNKGVALWEPDETVTRARIDSLGGPVTIIGTGGSAGGPWNVGVHAYHGSISAGGTGTVTVEGTGGQTEGGSNLGVWLQGTGEITSSGGDIQVTGTGRGEATAGSNFGVWAVEDGQIAGVGSANVTVTGYGGGGSGGNQIGVALNGNVGYGRITAVDGNLTVIGYGGGDGNSSGSEGVELWRGGEISTSGHGTVSIEGTGSEASGSTNHGVYLYGLSEADQPSQIVAALGAVTISGQGGSHTVDGTNTTTNHGVQLRDGARIVGAPNAELRVTGVGGASVGGTRVGAEGLGGTGDGGTGGGAKGLNGTSGGGGG